MNVTKRFGIRARAATAFTALTLISTFATVITATPALATDPSHVSLNLQGCDATFGGGVTLPIGGQFICPDGAYGNGNLGKGWNELDLVPFRVFMDATNAAPSSQTYTFAVALDSQNGGVTGFDFLSAPTLNSALSDTGGKCLDLSSSDQLHNTPGLGGVADTLYRNITIKQATNSTCVIDLYGRLALGSHSFPGSSLHGDLANEGATSSTQDRSIPVNEIQPQSIRKNMTATRDSDFTWNVTKGATPTSINFGNVCAGTFSNTATVAVTVSWVRNPATPSGQVTIITNIYVKNPSHRAVTVTLNDKLYSGTDQTTQVGVTHDFGTFDVPPGTETAAFTDTQTITSSASHFNDVATATYTDAVTHQPIPGQTTAQAGADVTTGHVTNGTAVVTDSESITGNGLTFKVAAPSVGSFTGGYTAGTYTTGPVGWSSGSVSGDGSVTFSKTIKLDPVQVTSGTLSDTANLTGSDGFTAAPALLSIQISSSATVSLTVSKKIPFVLGTGESASFTFNLFADGADPGTATPVGTTTITFGAGDGGNTAKTGTISGLSPSTDYDLYEVAPSGWVDPGKINVTSAGVPACSSQTDLTNSFGPATVDATKVASPSSGTAGWVFTLKKDSTTIATGTSAADGSVSWDLASTSAVETDPNVSLGDEGSYSIVETQQSGWDLTSIDTNNTSADVPNFECTFTVNFPGDFGKSYSCGFHNRQRGTIIVKKVTNPAGAAGSFTFTGDAAGTIGDGGTITVGNLVPGTYTSTESDPTPGFDLTGLSCNDGASPTPSTGSTATRTATFNLDPGETVTCTFTNTQRGTIIVKKLTDPANAPGSFTFTGDAAGTISSGGTITVNNLIPGTYTSTESDPTGFSLTGISCDDGSSTTPSSGSTATRQATFKLDPGETVTCTFTNTQKGTIIVKKLTDPANAPGSFTFTGDAAGTISSGGTITVNNLAPGTYTSTEGDPAPGFDLTDLSCDDGASATASTVSLATRTATFKLDPGETVTCTFTNTQRGTIIVKKVTNPVGAAGSFTFTGDAAGTISDGGTITVNNLVPGTYTSTENDPAPGFDLTGLSCNDGASTTPSSGSTSTRTATFKLDPGETVTCTFTNTQRGTIIVKKVTDPAGAPGNFTFTGTAAGTIGDGGTITVNNLVPGTYTSTENDPAPGFDLTGLSCNDGASTTPSSGSTSTRTATFKLDPGETVTCTFTNTQRGTIIVKKVTDPAGAPGNFTFTGTAAGTIGDGGTITVSNLAPGTYTSTESDPRTAFDLTGLSCNDSLSPTVSTVSLVTRTATFKLDPGETVTCTFTNTQRGHAGVVKTVNGAAPTGSQAFTFQLRSGASAISAGAILETLTANAANGGVINFTTDLKPGDTYQLCEQMQPGWMTTLGPPFFSVYNPSGDNSVVCTDFTVTAGQLKIFNIDNKPPPGGLALTIGFWKNWASCANSNGKQKAVLDKALLDAANSGYPVTLGLLVLDPNVLGATIACKDAVNLLNKTTIDGKTKKASDPLFNMAAQLIAADLNVAAGAGTCPAAIEAINKAHALLVKYKFDGLGYTPKLTSADAALANQYATTLDQYNNNKLC